MNLSAPHIDTEINAVISRQIQSSIVIATAVAGLISVSLWRVLDGHHILYWLALLVGISVLRISLEHIHTTTGLKQTLQLPLTAASGLIWGLSAPLFLPALDAQHQLLLILALVGIVAGSSNAYTKQMSLFYTFMLPTLTPLILWLFVQQQQVYTIMGMIGLIYMLALSIHTKRNAQILKNSMTKNDQLSHEINVRQSHEQRLQLQQQILNSIARHQGELPEILTRIVQQLEAQRPDMLASILLLDETGNHLCSGAAPSLPEAWNKAVDGAAIGPAAGSCGTAAFRNERVVVTDIANDPLWANYREAALAFELKACWSEPIHDAEGHVIGTFAMYYHTTRQPSGEDLELIAHIASLTSIAIDNCRNRTALELARKQHAELMDTVKQSSDMIYVYKLDGTITAANEACKTTFGGEVVGKNIADIVAPDQLQLAYDMIQKKLKTGANTVYEVDVIDIRGQRHSLEVNSSLMLHNGQPVAIHGIARDVTIRKKAEKQLALLTQAIHASHESIMVLDAEGYIEFANPAAAQLFQKPLQQIIGASAASLRGGQQGDATYHEIISTINSGQIWDGELLFHLQEKGERLVARRISPISDESGHIHHQVCIDRDITEAKHRSQQLEHTQRLESLGILAGGIAHDFNNLLAAIMGNAAMAERKLSAADAEVYGPSKAYLSRIRESSQRAAELCKQMLAYSGKGLFVTEQVNVSALIREMTRLMEVSIGKQITMRYAMNEDLPTVDADPAQIQQVILNLITNASEAIGEQSGEIAFSTGLIQADRAELDVTLTNENLPAGEYIYIDVCDDGCGMDANTLKKMFDPFFTTKFTGRGLGMSAILGIVRGHHGAIIVHSQPGQGTSFRILLPSSHAQLPVGEPSPADTALEHSAGLILIVDDEADIREVAAAMLEDMGFDIMEAVNGEEAVALYRQHHDHIRAVVLDMTMPKMDGKTCFAELIKINPNVRVLLSSGYSEQDMGDVFTDHIPTAFIQKPYMPEALQHKITAVLQ